MPSTSSRTPCGATTPASSAPAVGPYAATHLDPHAWRHAVLKCLFTGVPLAAVAHWTRRAAGDAEPARMLGDQAAERTAAGRDVPHGLRRVLTLTGEQPKELDASLRPAHDYDLQRFGPDDPHAHRAAAGLDTVIGPLLDDARAEGRTVVALSEYGITRVSRPVDINRALRRAGLLEVHTQDGMEDLDPTTSRAFAVADHRIAHVYVRRTEDLAATREALKDLPGIDELLDDDGKKADGLGHPRSGELVALAAPDVLVSTPRAVSGRVAATEVKPLLLRLAGLT